MEETMLDVRMCPIRVEIRTMIKARTSTCLKSTGMNKTIAANNGNPKLAVCVNESQPENVQADYSDLTEGPSGKQASSSVDSPSQLRSSKAPMSIYISYSPDASFLERKFICETVRQLKQTNFREETWFDKDEVDITFPFWLSQRLEAIEKCKGAIIFLSKSYFKCPISLMEGKILLERLRSSEKTVKIFPVLQNDVKVPQGLAQLLDGVMDLTGARIARNTLAEKSSLVIGNLSEKMKECALIKVPFQNLTTPILEFSKGFMVKKLYSWTVGDVQEWLCHLGIREVYRQTFAEYMVDGFLLLSVTDEDLSQYLGIDNRAVRWRVLRQIFAIVENEKQQPENWHIRARTVRFHSDSVYLIYDPADIHLAHRLRNELQKKGLQVLLFDKLVQSLKEFLQTTGPKIATAKKVAVLLTEEAAISPFVYHQILVSEWLGRPVTTAMFRNSWNKLRPSLKVILGDKPAIAFDFPLFENAVDILTYQLCPRPRITGVILEQAYLNRMAEGVKPLQALATSSPTSIFWPFGLDEVEPKVFISYQWDVQSKVQKVRTYLEANGLPCWADLSVRGQSQMSTRSSLASDKITETLQGQIQRNMKVAHAVVSCLTLRYVQSDNYHKDIQLAATLQKPVVPVLFQLLRWPPYGTSIKMRTFLFNFPVIDLSNDKLFHRNLNLILKRLRQYI